MEADRIQTMLELSSRKEGNIESSPKEFQFYWELDTLIEQALSLVGEI